MRTRKPEVTELEVNREHNPVRLLLRKDWQHIPQFQVHSDSQEVRLAELTDTRTAKGYAWCSLQCRSCHCADTKQPRSKCPTTTGEPEGFLISQWGHNGDGCPGDYPKIRADGWNPKAQAGVCLNGCLQGLKQAVRLKGC